MPGYIIHLIEADMVLKRLIQSADYANEKKFMDKYWERIFLYGNLLPDTLSKEEKGISHFWKEKDAGKVVLVPDLQAFSEKYQVQLMNPAENPLLFGYFVHLHLDYCFFRDYFRSCVSFLDSEGIETEWLEAVDRVLVKKRNQLVSLQTFFSEEYLYGDYTSLNHVLIEKYKLKLPEYDEVLFQDGFGVIEAKNGNLKGLYDEIEMFVANGSCSREDLRVFHIESLELFLEETAEKLIVGS